MRNKYIFWDFDGTLAFREGMWNGTLLEILNTREPGLKAARDDLRPHLSAGFPWHTPKIGHPHINDAELWWSGLLPIFERAFVSLGLSASRAKELAAEVPKKFCCPGKWVLFEDTVPALTELSERGWKHIILSNHVPELADLVDSLGISHFFEDIHTSAVTGYEKPHPEAFRMALARLPDPSRVWMVGDNPVADVRGAEGLGIPAILVRKTHPDVRYQCESLNDLDNILDDSLM